MHLKPIVIMRGDAVLVGWLGNSKSEYPTDSNYWAHMLTLPRELKIEGNKLLQIPIAELAKLRTSNDELTAQYQLKSPAFELELEVGSSFSIEFANERGDTMTFSGTEQEWCLDRTHVTDTYAEKFGSIRYSLRHSDDPRVRVFVDHSSIEIFCDRGETVFTSRIFVRDLNRLNSCNVSGKVHYLRGIRYD